MLALYGERWAGVAPVLMWVAVAQVFFIALPMQIDVGYLLGGWRKIVWLTIADAAISMGLLFYAAQFGLEWAAISRVAHGIAWWLLHAAFMQRLVGFSWREMFGIYARTAIAAIAAVGPLLAAYAVWMPPHEMGFAPLALLCLLGVVAWYLALVAFRHPSAGEIGDIFSAQLGRLRALRPRRS